MRRKKETMIPPETEGLENRINTLYQKHLNNKETYKPGKEIIKTTLELIQNASNDEEKAKLLLTWVYENIEYKTKANFGTPNYGTAEEVYQRKYGVDLDMAVLYTAMARVAGLEAGCASNREDHAYAYTILNNKTIYLDPTTSAYDVPCPESVLESTISIQSYLNQAKTKEHKNNFLAYGLIAAALLSMSVLINPCLPPPKDIQPVYTEEIQHEEEKQEEIKEKPLGKITIKRGL